MPGWGRVGGDEAFPQHPDETSWLMACAYLVTHGPVPPVLFSVLDLNALTQNKHALCQVLPPLSAHRCARTRMHDDYKNIYDNKQFFAKMKYSGGGGRSSTPFGQHLERDVTTNASIKPPESDAAPVSRQADHPHISPTILPTGLHTGGSDARVKLRHHAEHTEQLDAQRRTAPHRTARVPRRTKETRTQIKTRWICSEF